MTTTETRSCATCGHEHTLEIERSGDLVIGITVSGGSTGCGGMYCPTTDAVLCTDDCPHGQREWQLDGEQQRLCACNEGHIRRCSSNEHYGARWCRDGITRPTIRDAVTR